MNSTFCLVLMIGRYEKKREVLTEAICPACDGTGLQKVKQPTQPGRKIYPAKCEECLGKGRIKEPTS
jgi:DnaJ-class molecular chaperone